MSASWIKQLKKSREESQDQHGEDAPTPEQVELADREMPSVNGTKKGNTLVNKLALAGIGLLGLYLIYQFNTGPSKKDLAAAKEASAVATQNAVTGTLPQINVPDQPPELDIAALEAAQAQHNSQQASSPDGAAVPAPNGAQPIALAGQQPPAPPGAQPGAQASNCRPGQQNCKTPQELWKERRLSPSIAVKFESDRNGAPGSAGAAAGQQGNVQDVPGSQFGRSEGGGGGELANALQPTITKGTVAAKLFDRNYLIAKGSFIDCALETRLDSTVPGLTTCIVTKNVYSDNGKLILIDRGSKITGQYQGGIKQGQARIFVLWNRVQTPAGVVINLDSPGTDPLGASGHSGYVDTHFWERFGGAILLSMVADLGQYISNKGLDTNGDVTVANTSKSAQDMATEALKNSINIPPNLIKNQGDHINIFVARDMDFRGVYGLKTSQ